MAFDLWSRLAVVRRVLALPWVKFALSTWGAVCSYDTVLSQIVPDSLAVRFPKVKDMIAASSGWLPLSIWLLILAAILVVASFEYAFRRTPVPPSKTTSSPGLSMGQPPALPALVAMQPELGGARLGRGLGTGRGLAAISADDPAPSPRQFTNRTAQELLAFYHGLTPLQADKLIQPHKGLWIKVGGVVTMTLDGGADVVAILRDGTAQVECRFAKRWDAALMRFNPGDPMRVVGQIGPSQNGSQLYVLNCELASETR